MKQDLVLYSSSHPGILQGQIDTCSWADLGSIYLLTDILNECLIRLPVYCGLSHKEQDRIVDAVMDARRGW